MKKCPYCAEEIQPEALKCRYCNEVLPEGEIPAEVYDSTSEAYMGTLALFILLLLSFVWDFIKYGQYMKAVIALVLSPIFVLLAPYIWNLGNSIREYASPDIYFTSGLFDAIGKRFFWTYGVQVISIGILFVCIFGLLGFPDKNYQAYQDRVNEIKIANESSKTEQKQAKAPESDPMIEEVEEGNDLKPEAKIEEEIATTVEIEPPQYQNQYYPPEPEVVPFVNDYKSEDTSIDCSNIQSNAQTIVCTETSSIDNQSFIDLDMKVASLYKKQLENKELATISALQQNGWIANRDSCQDEYCLSVTYSERIRNLTMYTNH